MGNYKSRPGNSCTEEHLKKITELQSLLSQKVEADLQLREPGRLTELQEVRSSHTYALTHDTHIPACATCLQSVSGHVVSTL